MLQIYVRDGCPYCAMVESKVEELGLEVDYKNIGADHSIAQELVDKGGKRQVPYLIDDEQGVSMYESMDIVAHLEKHHSESAPT